MVTIYYNPRCGNSRTTLKILEGKGIQPAIIEYLNTPPDVATRDGFLGKLHMEPRQLMRRGEAPYKELNLAGNAKDREILIEQPVVVIGEKVALGRLPENMLGIC